MSQPAPGKYYREGLSWIELFDLFPSDDAAEKWFVENRWPNGIACPGCESCNVQERPTRKPQPYRCRDCRKDFSAKTGTIMQGSPLGFRVWAVAFYILTTGIKGTSSMKLHRDLKVTQKTAWFLAHRIRETWRDNSSAPFAGPVETDTAYFGGKEKNKHRDKKLGENHRAGKVAVTGVRDRETGKVRAAVVAQEDGETLCGFVAHCAAPNVLVYTDEAPVYGSLERRESVNHSVGRYVDGMAHTNGMESFWSLFKRGYHGTYHRISPKHLDRYVGEFEGRHNDRPRGTLAQMAAMVRGAEGKRLRYKDLKADNGRSRRAA